MAGREEAGGFNTRPPPWEVRQRVDRRRDRAIKLEGGAATADGDKYVGMVVQPAGYACVTVAGSLSALRRPSNGRLWPCLARARKIPVHV